MNLAGSSQSQFENDHLISDGNLGISEVKNCLTVSHARGTNIWGIGSNSASIK